MKTKKRCTCVNTNCEAFHGANKTECDNDDNIRNGLCFACRWVKAALGSYVKK